MCAGECADDHEGIVDLKAESAPLPLDRLGLGDFDIKSKPGQAILSVSGYGDARLVNEGKSKIARAENRRIDLRFIMMTPRSLKEADIVAAKIKLGMKED